MSAVIEDDDPCPERPRGLLGRRERDRILPAVHDERRDRDPLQGWCQVEVAEAPPHALLNSADDTERRQVAGTRRVGEIPGDAELERTVAIRVRIPFTKPRLGQLVSEPLDLRALLAA